MTSPLEKVIEAAEKWRDELTDYIEPDAEKRGADADAEGYQSEAEAIDAAIKELRSPAAPKLDYSPCIEGSITANGRRTEFMVPLDRGDIGYSQWGADTLVLGERVDLLESISAAAKEWALDNLDREEDGDD